MARRSTSQFKIDDRSFPVRVKFIVPEGGMRMLPIDVHGWLRDNLGHLDWAWGPADGIGRQVTAYHFRRIEDAQRFVEAFPELALADGVASPHYSSPAKDASPARRAHRAGRPIQNGWTE